MKITQLTIQHFRNLTEISLQPNTCNLIFGDNGSGKTSLLESIYLLSRGKSFRHHQPKHYIQHGYEQTMVFAKLQVANDNNQQLSINTPRDIDNVAIQKSQDASTILRHNGQNLTTQSPLTQLLPTLLLEPLTLDSLGEGSQTRRELLDWLVFHVEPRFHSHWVSYQKLLKQRNSLLKQVRTIHNLSQWQRQEISAWDSQISHHAVMIHQYRSEILAQWQDYFYQKIQEFLPHYASKMQLRYFAGFDVEQSLTEVLASRLSADIELGYTRMGCHRADINVMLQGEIVDTMGITHKQTLTAMDMLSRGEKKLLMTALRLSQLPLLNSVQKIPVVLLDDITAELDKQALQLLLNGLKQVNSQLFITSLSTEILDLVRDIWQNELSVFHVEQGNVVQDKFR